ncbi:hypothetical protein AVEN_114578-1 [Araneus ventricosus]|uniref:Uncharacterized protein n=1 Tax=Araneus ventricosus TaxID=182803 RepID=A0A4Y2V2C8_ARAVE|nr:hypothetical protein AVEN_114578-1 [Araneus ventricosus]
MGRFVSTSHEFFSKKAPCPSQPTIDDNDSVYPPATIMNKLFCVRIRYSVYPAAAFLIYSFYVKTLIFPAIGSFGKNNPADTSNICPTQPKNFQAMVGRFLVEMSSSRFPAVIFKQDKCSTILFLYFVKLN